MFITFEGPDGSGKTTQSKLLANYLEAQGKQVLWTREPGGSVIGQKLRTLLLEDKSLKLDPLTELFLFAADRAEHVRSVIKPALALGKIVVCDRYIDSTTAYQSGGRGFDRQMVTTLNLLSTEGLAPDKTFIIDVPSEVGLARVQTQRGVADKFEAEALGFHQRVRSMYLNIAQEQAQRCIVIDGTQPIEAIFTQISSHTF
jgi:dTMP kinase